MPKNNVIRVASMSLVFLGFCKFLVFSRPFILGENNPFYFPCVAACIKVWNRGKS